MVAALESWLIRFTMQFQEVSCNGSLLAIEILPLGCQVKKSFVSVTVHLLKFAFLLLLKMNQAHFFISI